MTRSRRPTTAGEWLLAVEAAVLLFWAAAAVRLLTLRRAADVMTAFPRTGLRTLVAPARVAEIVSAVGRCVGCGCLPQALVTHRLLVHQCVASEIVIGTVRTPAGLRAHAWVHVEGRPIGDGDVSAYVPIYVLDRRSGRRAA